MQVTKIDYETEKGQDFSATVLDITKEEAINFLRKIVKVRRIKSISSLGTVHAIGDNIIDKIINSSDQMKKYEQRLETAKKKYEDLDEQLKSTEYELEQIKQERDKKAQQPSSAEIAKAMKKPKEIYLCPFCDKPLDTKAGLKQHISKMHKKEKINDAGNEDNTPKSES
jgi:chromosome segregation ATPase